MSYEYEYKYKDFDKKYIVKKLKDLDAMYNGKYIFKVQIFTHPTKKKTLISELEMKNTGLL